MRRNISLVKHLTAEKQTEEFVAGKGVVVKWERVRKQNHWFDALYNAPPARMELVVSLDSNGNAVGSARPVEPGRRIVQVRPGEKLMHGVNEYRVLAVEVFRSLPAEPCGCDPSR